MNRCCWNCNHFLINDIVYPHCIIIVDENKHVMISINQFYNVLLVCVSLS